MNDNDISGVDDLRHKLDEVIEVAEAADVITEEQHFSLALRVERLAAVLGLVVV